jgi:protein TonB
MREIIILTTLVFFISPVTKGQDGNAHDPFKNQTPEMERAFIVVEKKPEYPGGFAEFYKYINKNLKYPKTAKRNGVSGKIFVEFVVNSNGRIDDESVHTLAADELNELGWSHKDIIVNKECEFEAIRLLKECSDWKPAMQKGKPVRVVMIVPINFLM